MKIKVFVFCILCIAPYLGADIHLQGGIESYMGSNNLFTLTPWIGLRVGLFKSTSLLLKYYNHNISFNHTNVNDEETERKAHLSNFTVALYTQKWGHDFYSAISYFSGTDSYSALALDTGTELKITKRIYLDVGIYLINEKSILWYPNEAVRNIFLDSVKGGVKFKITKWLSICPKIYAYRNSEDVNAGTYSMSAIINPMDPIYISLIYFKYHESAQYRFSGDYISIGLNFYY